MPVSNPWTSASVMRRGIGNTWDDEALVKVAPTYKHTNTDLLALRSAGGHVVLSLCT